MQINNPVTNKEEIGDTVYFYVYRKETPENAATFEIEREPNGMPKDRRSFEFIDPNADPEGNCLTAMVRGKVVGWGAEYDRRTNWATVEVFGEFYNPIRKMWEQVRFDESDIFRKYAESDIAKLPRQVFSA